MPFGKRTGTVAGSSTEAEFWYTVCSRACGVPEFWLLASERTPMLAFAPVSAPVTLPATVNSPSSASWSSETLPQVTARSRREPSE